MMVTGCENSCHHSGSSAADDQNFTHGIFLPVFFHTCGLFCLIKASPTNIRNLLICYADQRFLMFGGFVLLSPGIIFLYNNAKEPAYASSFLLLLHIQLYWICSVLFVGCFLVNFCFLSLTVFEEIHGYLWEQCVC